MEGLELNKQKDSVEDRQMDRQMDSVEDRQMDRQMDRYYSLNLLRLSLNVMINSQIDNDDIDIDYN